MIRPLGRAVVRFIAHRRIGPRNLQIRAWMRLARETDDLEEQMRCLKAVVALDASLDWAQAALTRVWYRWRQQDKDGPIAGRHR